MNHCNHQGWGQHFPPQGPQFAPGPQCVMMKPPAFMNMNPPPFPGKFPEPWGMNCNMQGGMPYAPQAPPPCDTKCAEPCDAKTADKQASPSNTPCHEPCTMKSSPPKSSDRCSPFRPPRPTLPGMSGCPPPRGSKMGTLLGFPASSRCFPPRKMYQYTTSKTFKSCYAN